MVIIQTNDYLKYFFFDLFDAKVSNESFYRCYFQLYFINAINLCLSSTSSICVDLSLFLIRANFENYFK